MGKYFLLKSKAIVLIKQTCLHTLQATPTQLQEQQDGLNESLHSTLENRLTVPQELEEILLDRILVAPEPHSYSEQDLAQAYSSV